MVNSGKGNWKDVSDSSNRWLIQVDIYVNILQKGNITGPGKLYTKRKSKPCNYVDGYETVKLARNLTLTKNDCGRKLQHQWKENRPRGNITMMTIAPKRRSIMRLGIWLRKHWRQSQPNQRRKTIDIW